MADAQRTTDHESTARCGPGWSRWVTATTVAAAGATIVWLERRRRQLRTRLNERERTGRALRRGVEAVAAALHAGDAYREIAGRALDVTEADGAFVERLAPDRRTVEVVAAAGRGVPPLGSRVPTTASFTDRGRSRGGAAVLTDVRNAARAWPEPFRSASPGTSALFVPLGGDAVAAGALVLLRGPGRAVFTPADIESSRTFGHLASLALRKIHLFEVSERRRRDMERLLESRARLMRGFSHDLKNPLGAVDGYAQLLEEGVMNGLTERQKESVGRIRRSIRSALRLIDDLVAFARVEAGQLELEPTPTDIADLVRDTAEEYAAIVAAESLALSVQAPEQPASTETDPVRVRQILGNLLSNAVKYTPEGGKVTVAAAEVQDGTDAPGPGRWITVSVIDTGPGIPPERQEEIFEEFTRAHGERAGGAGLGLAISRRLARLLGGDLTVTSEVGKGSTFTLWLPLRPAAQRGRERRAADG